MARKKPHEEHENHERWLVSYADFITLLFAFFVVMYSISSVNEGKYRVLSDALVSAFRSSQKSLMPIQIGQNVKTPSSGAAPPEFMQSPKLISTPASMQIASGGLVDDDSGSVSKGRGGLEKLSRKVAAVMAKLIDEGLVVIHRKKNWVEVVIKDSFLFSAGTANMLPQARAMLDKVAGALHDVTNPMRIEGYTDDQIIHSDLYPSNWELSMARAVTVIKQFERNGISAWRMSATGYGQFRPSASNSTEEGRAKNRRVAIIIMASHAAESEYDVNKSAETEQLNSGQSEVAAKPGDEAGTQTLGTDAAGAAGTVPLEGAAQSLAGSELAKNESGHVVSSAPENGDGAKEAASFDGSATPSSGKSGDVLPPPIRLPPPIQLPIVVPH